MMEGISSRGGVDRRAPRARPPRLRLRRQPHHDRRHHLAHVHDRGQGQALRGVRLARPARRRLGGSGRAARRAGGGEGRGGAPVADRPAQPHRLSGTACDRHREGSRRPARRGRDPGDEGDHGLRSRRDLRRLGRRARAHGGRCRAGRGAAARVGRAPGRLGRSLPGAGAGARARPARRAARGLARGAARVPGRRGGRDARCRPQGDAGPEAVHADDGGRVGRPRRVEQDRVRGRRRLLRRCTRAATSPSGSASTRWARS